MQRAESWRWWVVVAASTLVVGCAGRDLAGVTAPVSGPSAARAAYAYSTDWGDMWEEDGELMPAGYGQPWNAVIVDKKSTITWDSGCSASRCDVDFNAWMAGLWHTTKQEIHWTLGSMSGTSPKTSVGWNCVLRFGPLNCALAERANTHEVRIDGHCRWDATMRTEHSAWWGSWFDLQVFGKKVGQIGPAATSSIATDRSFDDCASGPGGGGGGGGGGDCYDVWFYWWDDKGYHEVYVGQYCVGDAT